MFCSQCGNTILPGVKFCGKCGAAFSTPVTIAGERPERPTFTSMALGLLFALGIIAICIVGALLLDVALTRSEPNEQVDLPFAFWYGTDGLDADENLAVMTEVPTPYVLPGHADLIIRAFDYEHDSDTLELSEYSECAADVDGEVCPYYEAQIPAETPFGVFEYWCAEESQILQEVWSKLEFTLIIDDQVIPLTVEHEQSFETDKWVCRAYDVIIEGLSIGTHQVIVQQTIKAAFNDGFDSYEPGVEETRYEVVVGAPLASAELSPEPQPLESPAPTPDTP